MSKELILWAVYTNADLTEGRGREFVKHFCRTEATARRLAKNGYVQGTDCPIKEVKAIEVDGKHFLPTSMLTIVEPSAEDTRAQQDIDAWRVVREKARSIGLTGEEIDILVKGCRR